MGYTNLRRLVKQETQWSDKNSIRHKHTYSREVCVDVQMPDRISYYHVIMCERCKSFKCVSTENNCSGFSRDIIKGLPIVMFHKSRKTIGFEGMVFVKEE